MSRAKSLLLAAALGAACGPVRPEPRPPSVPEAELQRTSDIKAYRAQAERRERAGDLRGAAEDLEEACRLAGPHPKEKPAACADLERVRAASAAAPASAASTSSVTVPASAAAGGVEMHHSEVMGPDCGRTFLKARSDLQHGDAEAGAAALTAMLPLTITAPDCEQLRYDAMTLLAASHLRSGGPSACAAADGAPACLFPGGVQDLSVSPKDAEEAIRGFTAVLEWKPVDLQARWLLNLAYMAAGRYPDGVPKRWLIPPEALRGAPFKRFTDAAPRLGVDVLGHAGGSIMEDFDGDGKLDLMLSSNKLDEPLRYFHNDGAGGFVDWTAKAGLAGIGGGVMIAQGDYDHDGFPDVIVRVANEEDGERDRNQGLILLHNEGGVSFKDVTRSAGLSGVRPGWVAVWGDYDGDGFLDLFTGSDDSVPPKTPQRLFHNDGHGRFTDVAASAGISTAAFAWGAAWGDYDDDGRPDLLVSEHGVGPVLYRNLGPDRDGRWRFENATKKAGLKGPRDGFTCWFWDYDNDGHEDILIVDYPPRVSAELAAADALGVDYGASHPVLYHNRGDGAFEDVSTKAGLTTSAPAMGANFGDLDMDGYLDFYAGSGDPDMRALVPNRAFRGVGGARFEEVTAAAGLGLLAKGHGISIGDVDDDGDDDILAEMGGHHRADAARSALFLNPGFGNAWVTLTLEGTSANRSAIGARIRVRAVTPEGPRDVYRTVGSGGSFGSNPLRQTVGLGRATAIDSIEIRWPGAKAVQRLEHPPLDSFLRARQGAAGFEVRPRTER